MHAPTVETTRLPIIPVARNPIRRKTNPPTNPPKIPRITFLKKPDFSLMIALAIQPAIAPSINPHISPISEYLLLIKAHISTEPVNNIYNSHISTLDTLDNLF